MRQAQRRVECIDVMTVDPRHLGAEGAHLVVDRLHSHDVRHAPVDLLAVDIYQADDVADFMKSHAGEGLPHLALLQLAVGHENVHEASSPFIRRAKAMPAAWLIAWPNEPPLTS